MGVLRILELHDQTAEKRTLFVVTQVRFFQVAVHMEHMAYVLLLLGAVNLHLRLDTFHAQKQIQRMRHPKQEVIVGAGHEGRRKIFRNILPCLQLRNCSHIIPREIGFKHKSHLLGSHKLIQRDKIAPAVHAAAKDPHPLGSREGKQFRISLVGQHGQNLVSNLTACGVTYHKQALGVNTVLLSLPGDPVQHPAGVLNRSRIRMIRSQPIIKIASQW